jgi:hypothetical protein
MSVIKPPTTPLKSTQLKLPDVDRSSGPLRGTSKDDLDALEAPGSPVCPSRSLQALDLAAPKFKSQKTPDNRILWKDAKEWLLINSEATRPAAKAILRNIERISVDHFDAVFADGIKELVSRKSPDRPLVCVLPDVGIKSNHWMAERAAKLIPTLFDDHLAVGSHFSQASQKLEKEYAGKSIDFCLIDDASYSGTQASQLVRAALSAASQSGVTVGSIFVVLVCASRYALEAISTAVEPAEYREKINLVGRPISMRTLADLYRQGGIIGSELEMLKLHVRELQPSCYDKADPEKRLGLTYLPHKMPDEVSVLHSIMAWGYGLRPREGIDTYKYFQGVRFIPDIWPPYKER